MTDEKVIQLNNVSIFHKENLVISNLNLEVKKGEFVYLLGKTGSGKSSILKLFYGEVPLTQGTGWIAGYNLSTIKRREIPFLRRKLGIVFQDFQLLNDRSVKENLRFVMRATGWSDEVQMSKKITDVLNKVGLIDKETKMPHQLSGGEQQRVSVARALVNDPEIILADEPTGNLDPETSEEIMRLLQEISKSGRSVIFATHDIMLYNKFPSRTLRCENGMVSYSESKIKVSKQDQ